MGWVCRCLQVPSVLVLAVLCVTVLGMSALSVCAASSDAIPLDHNGLPMWEVKVWNDFPVRLVLADRAQLDHLLSLVPIASFGREQIRVAGSAPEDRRLVFEPRITEQEAAALKAAGYEFERLPDLEKQGRQAVERTWAQRAASGFASPAGGRDEIFYYPTHTEIGSVLSRAASDHPTIARTFLWGYSVQGREMWGLVISDDVNNTEPEPEVRLTSSMHGDETLGMVLLLNFIEYLTDNYGQPGYDDVTNLVDNYEIHLMPLHNPDGYVLGQRYNANGVDLNRNFLEPAGTHSELELENVNFSDYSVDQHFVVSFNMHGGALVINYPWDYTHTLTPDDAAIIQLSLEYSTYNLPMYNSPQFDQGITNGADWYVITGSLQDWSYYATGCIDVTAEIGTNKSPDEIYLESYWDDNRESMMHYTKAARYGVNGVVTDSDTGLPIGATITVDGIDKDVYTDPEHGDYYKLLDTGTYDITYSAAGYAPQTLTGVATTWGTPTVRDVALDPLEVTILFTDDFESGTGDWSGDWGLANPPDGHDSANSLTDSPDGDYLNGADNACTMVGSVDLSGAIGGQVAFWAKWEIENSWDACFFQISTDGGASWTSLATQYTNGGSGQGVQQPEGVPLFDYNQTSWCYNTTNLSPYISETDVSFRFVLRSDSSVRRDGFYFDDFEITIDGSGHVAVETPAFTHTRLTAQPNPFNPATNIAFTTDAPGPVQLAVYDVQGRLVRTLADEDLPAGRHASRWDGRTDTGAAAASGVYFAIVRTTRSEQAIKLMLVK